MNRSLKVIIAAVAIAVSGTAIGQCTTATINGEMAKRTIGLTQDGISPLLGCKPIALAPGPGVPESSPIYAWGYVAGGVRRQIAVQFDRSGLAMSARYQEIPLSASNSSDDDLPLALAIALFAAKRNAAMSGAVCSPATINPGAVQMIRPHMTPQTVSGVLGCAPMDVSASPVGVWIWAVPLVDQLGAKMQVAVVFDEAGALSAQYQVVPPVVRPIGNGALRVEPPTITGNWVPGVMP